MFPAVTVDHVYFYKTVRCVGPFVLANEFHCVIGDCFESDDDTSSESDSETGESLSEIDEPVLPLPRRHHRLIAVTF